MKIKEVHDKIQKIATTVDRIPWSVWTTFYNNVPELEISGDQISIGNSDYKTVEEWQTSLTWFVEQFGGKVKWKK